MQRFICMSLSSKNWLKGKHRNYPLLLHNSLSELSQKFIKPIFIAHIVSAFASIFGKVISVSASAKQRRGLSNAHSKHYIRAECGVCFFERCARAARSWRICINLNCWGTSPLGRERNPPHSTQHRKFPLDKTNLGRRAAEESAQSEKFKISYTTLLWERVQSTECIVRTCG